ncbi:MAG: exosortase [Pseudomonadota bacterium]|jgi:exosortase B
MNRLSSSAPSIPGSLTPGGQARKATLRLILPWAVLLAGLMAAYVPTVADLFRTLWSTEQNAHGPLVLVMGLGLLFHKGRQAAKNGLFAYATAPTAGGAVLLLGVVLYTLGRSQTIYALEIGSLIPVLMGVVLIFLGRRVLRHLWFGFFFLLFMVPLPGSVVDSLTQPLKLVVSMGAEQALYAMGYPIARTGVVLGIGQYQLLVADACAGLNSLFTLEALGLLYVNVTRHESALRNSLLALLIIPISLASNIIRVIILALVTYHHGDAAGQGFVHGLSGIILFITALLLIIGVDSVLRLGVHTRRRRGISP